MHAQPVSAARAESRTRLLRHHLVALGGLLAASIALWALAYQAPLQQTLYVGGQIELNRRDDDGQFLRGANGSEPAERVDAADDPRGYRWWFEEVRRTGEPPYRWMEGDAAVVIPGAGGGPYIVALTARSGRPPPDSAPAASLWTAGTRPPVPVSIAPQIRTYRLLVPTLANGELRLGMQTELLDAPNDPRELAFVLHRVQLRDVGPLPRTPSWSVLGTLALAVAALYGVAVVLQIGQAGALALAGGAALAATAVLALARPALTTFAPALGGLALGYAGLGAAAWALSRAQPTATRRTESAHVLALVLLAFALRMGGMLHPQAIFSDLGFHAGKLFQATLGQVFLVAPLPADAGGGNAPYPPGFYLMLLPGEIFAPVGQARRLLVQGGAALFDSLAIALIWATIRRAGFGRPAAALGAACYLLPTPALESFSIGEYANLGGQALALPLLALIGLGVLQAGRERTTQVAGSVPRFALLVAAVALGLLGHSGVTLSVGAMVATAWAFAWLTRLRGREPAVGPLLLTGGAAAGLLFALLFFYSAPVYLAVFSARAGGGGGVAPLQLISDTVRALLGLAPPQATRVALPPLVGPLGLIGFALLLRAARPLQTPLRALLAAVWGGTALTLGLLLLSDQGVRWAIFLYPALCIGAGVALNALWRRGPLGRAAALAIVAVIVGSGLLAWIAQIRDYPRI